VCPITAARSVPRYPNEVAIPIGEAGQTRAGVILCHQVRTISLLRASGALPQLGTLLIQHYGSRVALSLLLW
jgi:mRNA-degrading endonuclease toxin of MazEF toxin-antitoxin module